MPGRIQQPEIARIVTAVFWTVPTNRFRTAPLGLTVSIMSTGLTCWAATAMSVTAQVAEAPFFWAVPLEEVVG